VQSIAFVMTKLPAQSKGKRRKNGSRNAGEKRTTTCRHAVRRKDGRSDGRETRVRGCMPPACYGERVESRRDIERVRPGATWPPPLSKTLARCHVAPHNEAARWASVILAPGLGVLPPGE